MPIMLYRPIDSGSAVARPNIDSYVNSSGEVPSLSSRIHVAQRQKHIIAPDYLVKPHYLQWVTVVMSHF